ncbi:MAG: ribonuclease Z [Flavobacteriales bacterium]|nr:MAG: ribonuclease Z [Flavobacteriales bacterium]
MYRFEVTTIGTGAALPAAGRQPSAQVVNLGDRLYLVDCGEGTQEQLRRHGIRMPHLRHIFISHLHGDHYLGLMGLLSTLHLLGRTEELHVHGPEQLGEIIHVQLRASQTWLRYPLRIHVTPTNTGVVVMQDERVEVTALELQHRIPCTGFLFREKHGALRLRPDAVDRIPHYQRNAVKDGEDLVLADGTVVRNAELTVPHGKPRTYAYCSDTAYRPALVEALRGVDLLYHEATFTEHLAGRAKETMHSTAAQAATLARDAAVGELLLGHFSSRYKSVEPLLKEALAIFPNTTASVEGGCYPIGPPTGVGKKEGR